MPASPSQHRARCQLEILSMVASCQLLPPKFQPQNHPHEPTEDSFLVAYCTSARSLRQRCGSPKCHRTRGALRIRNIEFEAERREFKQDKAWNIVTCPLAGEITIRQAQPPVQFQLCKPMNHSDCDGSCHLVSFDPAIADQVRRTPSIRRRMSLNSGRDRKIIDSSRPFNGPPHRLGILGI
jgi:hypothetical protein